MSDYDCNKFLYSGAVVLVFFACQPYSSAAKTQSTPKPASAHVLSEIEIVEKLRDAKVVDPTYALSAKKTPDEVVVTTELNPKFNDNDTKVQSVLIAKTAFGLIPGSVQRVKVLFKNEHGEESNIVVSRLLVTSFGEGKMDETTMLKSLELERTKSEPGLEIQDSALELEKVVPGPLAPERQLQLGNIEYLKEKGVDVRGAQQLFAEQEKNAAAGNKDAVAKSLRNITAVLSTLKDNWKAAQKREALQSKYYSASPSSGSVAVSGGIPSSKRPHDLAPLIVFLGLHRVNIDSELTDMKDAKVNGTNTHDFHLAIKRRLLAKFYNLPLNVQRPFMDRNPSLFESDDTQANAKNSSANGKAASKTNSKPSRQLPYIAR